jgi:hypothetical protein
MSFLNMGKRNFGRTRSRSSSFHTFTWAVKFCPVWKFPPTAMLSSGVTTAWGHPPGLHTERVYTLSLLHMKAFSEEFSTYGFKEFALNESEKSAGFQVKGLPCLDVQELPA